MSFEVPFLLAENGNFVDISFSFLVVSRSGIRVGAIKLLPFFRMAFFDGFMDGKGVAEKTGASLAGGAEAHESCHITGIGMKGKGGSCFVWS